MIKNGADNLVCPLTRGTLKGVIHVHYARYNIREKYGFSLHETCAGIGLRYSDRLKKCYTNAR